MVAAELHDAFRHRDMQLEEVVGSATDLVVLRDVCRKQQASI